MMKSLMVLILAAALLIGGCTMTETAKTNHQRVSGAQKMQMRMLVEDIEYVFLLEKPSFMTPWAVRSGLPL